MNRVQADRHTVSRRRRLGLTAMKRFTYSQLQVAQAAKVLVGRDAPLVRFTVEADPPSAYLNFAVRADRVDRFAAACGVPQGLELAPIRCIEGDEPFVCLTANIYRVSGIANGVRLEWSTYVYGDRPGVPRYLIVDAISSMFSLDPVDTVTPKGRCTYEREGGRVVARADGGAGSLGFGVELPDDEPDVLPTREWVEANDRIYWKNGVCDRVYYDAAFHNTPMWRVDPSSIGLVDRRGGPSGSTPSPGTRCSAAARSSS